MVEITLADYQNPKHRQAVVAMLNDYAQDPMGGGEALPDETRQNLVDEMAKRDYVFSLLAFVDDEPVGLANCVEGFSTFAAKPVMNIHDIAVIKDFRGQGIAKRLLQEVETLAQFRGCVKLTLEVLEGNEPAKLAYDKFGFKPYQLDEATGKAEFWQKYI
ncbi:GNAT family N-acetyltransferase [Pseudidiomarina terrestris]|uniref:GNAT family N-acetyltransferase n=1 Tax=Pseudidiomarina terrestris TaxID=2820060 RepID=UPI002650D990|nr:MULTISPECIES: GNAT family N-acetyltransferase [unclassified Pseudidiomarina]MDN7127998.1 GNAT family N-acetyltransferase [Pseudidiomarina sp. 1APR75-33.1]MDN7135657.1 GNAT family N-acetyltransferase [Pseudidiomarina sp. 1ASP75-5]MDN7137305.1 GNAT family N-acetyltransferase [Pseudidiomarina sp. 1ASP75-14]MEA3588598.1 GNAT family N-acetyltransferase [Pseudidiomarina sp. 1APP75-27a]